MGGKTRVLVVSTGGTILSRYTPDGGYSPAVAASELVGSVPGLSECADVEVREFCNILSFGLDPETVFRLAAMMRDTLESGDWAGAVVLQGTGSMEETAYLVDLLHTCEKPVVFTGAMYSAAEPDSDGPRNVLYSVMVAASPAAVGKGAMVCLNGEIHAARDVIKTHKSDAGAFKSPNTGPLGLVSKRGLVFHREPLLRRTFEASRVEPRVDLVKVVIGCDSRFLRASVENGAKAIVIEAFPGNGGVTPAMMPYIRELRSRDFPVIMAPRSAGGRVTPGAGGGCGPADLVKCGVILAGDLPAQKARVLAMVGMAVCRSTAELRDLFADVAP
ncbi:MAG: asparaginase [Ignavibacteriales bacterium]